MDTEKNTDGGPGPEPAAGLQSQADAAKLPRNILVALDFSEGSSNALGAAIALAEAAGASIELLYVDQLPLEELPLVFGYFDLEEGGYYAWVQREMAKRAGRVQAAGIPCRATQIEGRPAAEIVRHAAEIGADMIVIGTHGRTGLAHAVLGSVAERVVRQAACPVLTVPLSREVA
jgi:nucleotide-binding universal stress UspA family protein